MKRFISYSALALLCGALSTPLVMAQSTEAKPAADAQQNSSKTKDASKSDQRFDATIAKLGERIELTADQKGKIKSVMYADQVDMTSAWSRFADNHVKMISLEAEMVAAMDDILEPKQQEKVEAKRQQKDQAAADAKTVSPNASNDKDKKTAETSSPNGKEPKSTKTPTKKSATTSTSKTAESGETPAADSNRDGKTEADEVLVWTMVIVPVQEEYSLCEMSNAQTVQCDQVCQSYHKELVQLHQEIRNLHGQLVRMEAKEINQIEGILTSKQLAQLRDARKQATPSKLSATSTTNSKR